VILIVRLCQDRNVETLVRGHVRALYEGARIFELDIGPQLYRVCEACISSVTSAVRNKDNKIDEGSQALVHLSARSRIKHLRCEHGTNIQVNI
jgi:hypothetical protein